MGLFDDRIVLYLKKREGYVPIEKIAADNNLEIGKAFSICVKNSYRIARKRSFGNGRNRNHFGYFDYENVHNKLFSYLKKVEVASLDDIQNNIVIHRRDIYDFCSHSDYIKDNKFIDRRDIHGSDGRTTIYKYNPSHSVGPVKGAVVIGG